jgi:hypothetical protein
MGIEISLNLGNSTGGNVMEVPKFVWYLLALVMICFLLIGCIVTLLIVLLLTTGENAILMVPGVTLWILTLR